MTNLFGETKYQPLDEKDLADYLLKNYEEARNSVDDFMVLWINFLLDRELTLSEIRRLKNFSIINGNRRRQELQLENYLPKQSEINRRQFLAKGEHLRAVDN